jgi:hypothetical protein
MLKTKQNLINMTRYILKMSGNREGGRRRKRGQKEKYEYSTTV